MKTTALIAEDEPLLAAALQAELARQWPELEVVAAVADGQSAVDRALEHRPEVVFLDIRMPGLSGLDAAEALAEDWPDEVGPLPLCVFVTAYDEYAVRAFDHAAIDYVLKPVVPERLAKTCSRLRDALEARRAAAHSGSGDGQNQPQQRQGVSAGAFDDMTVRLRALLAGTPGMTEPLRVIQAAAGNTITMIPVDEVVYFEAADKYVRVVTADREHLIRLSLRDLRDQLDPARFWQIHRGTIVRADAVASAVRDEAGKLSLTLRGQADRLTVSRLYADRFKPM
ncbi:Uncharacterized response regulatory protein VV2_1193 [Pararobbsia alpina]|uniref:LytR/AlgR family response regulator transcription factor n=1 Tax=Pararobbsia alpina TaxID=621374 RepID=UPI0039A4E255